MPGKIVRAAMAGGNTIGAEVREPEPRADGYRHLDSPALIERLTAAGVTTYLYGIWDSPTDWDDLRREFLPAAAAAGIEVWVYVVPPSECFPGGRCSQPYQQDYLAWAREIAKLSRDHPCVTGWGIDDFHIGANREKFTPEYVAEMHETYRAINPDLEFWLCAYYDAAVDGAFLDTYAPFIDGIIYPYLDDPFHNTENADAVAARCAEIAALTGPRKLGLLLLVYCGRFLGTPRDPDEEYAAACVRTGLRLSAEGRLGGVVAYGLPLAGKPAPASENRALYGTGRLAFTATRYAPVPVGSSAWASQRVGVVPDAPRHELSFWHRADWLEGTPSAGCYVKEVLLDGVVVWHEDVTENPPRQWLNGHPWQGAVDVGAQLRGKTEATLTFRLTRQREAAGFGVDVGFDRLETIGCTVTDPDFDRRGGWAFGHDHGALNAAIDLAHPDRPRRILAAVTGEFGAAAPSPPPPPP
ncbi:hypothetical protein [Amycolatopsis sp. CA-230715]|uniref:hypothetical protein n=1 Tax=Amycolatopsis sp. CA-230715 TaxID=2745196 RepID=UPI001C02F693|nr:hypothetical protein [Amycolatopsis sp. CA-230715]QWF77772.1 hypothetical protein HUW46_01164 [Amycolatopsis sp. CA-230715]